jgi:hypothetical protein
VIESSDKSLASVSALSEKPSAMELPDIGRTVVMLYAILETTKRPLTSRRDE